MTVQTYAPIIDTVQAACRLLSIPVPSGVYDSQDENAQLLGAQANLIGQMFVGEHKWQQFRGTFELTGNATQTVFPIPVDYYSLTDDTGWSYATRRPCYLVNAQQWNGLKAWVSTWSMQPVFRLMNDNFEFLRAPAAGEIIKFEYAKRNWVISATDPGTLKNALTANGDTPMIDALLLTIALKIKWRETKGFDTNADVRDYETRASQILDKDQPGQILNLNGVAPVPYLSGANLPITGYGG